jgi:hypothetical protein
VESIGSRQIYGTSREANSQAQKGTDGNSEEVPNPAYETWKTQEEQVLSYLMSKAAIIGVQLLLGARSDESLT